MNNDIRSLLWRWRAEESQRRNVEFFRIFSNRTIDGIATSLPQTKEELLAIHGIGEKKAAMFGKTIFSLVRRCLDASPEEDISEKVFSVGTFLDRVNSVFSEMPGSVRGEIGGADVRDRYVFFTLKDDGENAAMAVFMWRREYDLCGVEAREGTEVIVRGQLEVYKPSGRLSFRARVVELVGEGAIRAAYERLKNRLEEEGLFAPERKRSLSLFPHRIGLITSRDGAVIHDFMSNIGKFGFKIFFSNSRVEGQLAVEDLLRSMQILKKIHLDVLVIIRGGGSLESLAAFNNEMLIREITSFPSPVICGIGHDKDVPLASLAADTMVSTPTAVTREINRSWEQARNDIDILERDIFYQYEMLLNRTRERIEIISRSITSAFSDIVERCRLAEERFLRCLVYCEGLFFHSWKNVAASKDSIVRGFESMISRLRAILDTSDRIISTNDPRRQLRLGYGIVLKKGSVLRSVRNVSEGDEISVLLSDGKILSRVEEKILEMPKMEKDFFERRKKK